MINHSKFTELKFLTKNFIYIFFFAFGLYNVISYFVEPKLKAENLTSISGSLNHYDFKVNSSGFKKPKTHEYYIYLNEYPSKFQIPAIFLNYFSENDFKLNMHEKDELAFGIRKNDLPKLESKTEKILIYSLKKGNQVYLNKPFTLKESNSTSDLVFGVILMILSIIGFKFRNY